MKTNLLSEKAMLVHLSISRWTARSKDRTAGEDISQQKKAEADVANVWVQLVPKDEMKEVYRSSGAIRKIWIKYTLPWMDEGIRILPSDLYVKFSGEVKKAITEDQKAIEKFAKRFPDLVATAPDRLGDFINDNPLPHVNEIKDKFGVKLNYMPMPTSGDFRCQILETEADMIRKDIEKNVQSATQDAMKSIWAKLDEMVTRIATTLKDSKAIFRDSLINNLREYVDLIPNLNLTGDPELEKIRLEAKSKLSKLMPENLRKHKRDRKQAALTAEEIMKKIQDKKL